MKGIDRLKLELKKAKEDLTQQEFFVHWLESQIKLEEIKELDSKELNSEQEKRKWKK